QGVIVATTASAAMEAGLVSGDVIHGVNGTSVRSVNDLRAALEQVTSDSAAVLHVGREGRLRLVTVTLE
ncbi:MAG TPA: PDZ domain-containing protein, partial [Gemmatimonadales bacterium]|nr:PDZ domain-containing protein [Gemmatimonadales bacterium]